MNGYDDSAVMGFGYWFGWLVGLIFLAIIIVLVVKIVTHKRKQKKIGRKSDAISTHSEGSENNNRPTP